MSMDEAADQMATTHVRVWIRARRYDAAVLVLEQAGGLYDWHLVVYDDLSRLLGDKTAVTIDPAPGVSWMFDHSPVLLGEGIVTDAMLEPHPLGSRATSRVQGAGLLVWRYPEVARPPGRILGYLHTSPDGRETMYRPEEISLVYADALDNASTANPDASS